MDYYNPETYARVNPSLVRSSPVDRITADMVAGPGAAGPGAADLPMSAIDDTLAAYSGGGFNGGPVLAQLRDAQARFRLSNQEVADGLNYFGQWHGLRFGGPFTSESSGSGIANGAIQNALNDKGFRKNSGLGPSVSSYSYYPVNLQGQGEGGTSWTWFGAQSYADSPEQIAAARRDSIAGAMPAARTIAQNTRIATGYNSVPWSEDQLTRLAGMMADNGADKVIPWFKFQTDHQSDAGANSQWWGPEAYLSAAASSLGYDPARYVNQGVLDSEQRRIGAAGQESQRIGGGRADNLGQFLAVASIAAGGIGLLAEGFGAAGLGAADLTAASGAGGLGAEFAGTTALDALGGGAAAAGGISDAGMLANALSSGGAGNLGLGATTSLGAIGGGAAELLPGELANFSGGLPAGGGVELGNLGQTVFQDPNGLGPLKDLTPQLPNEFAPPELPGGPGLPNLPPTPPMSNGGNTIDGGGTPGYGPGGTELTPPGQVGTDGGFSGTTSMGDGLMNQFRNLLSGPASTLASVASTLGMSPGSLTSLLGRLVTGALDYSGASRTADRTNANADRAFNVGAPYRAQLAALDANPQAYLDSPEVRSIVDRGTSAMARSLSARDGNPVGSGRALTEIQDYATGSLNRELFNRRNQLANFGGLSNFNAAAPQLGQQAAQSESMPLSSIGNTIGRITNPEISISDLMRRLQSGGLSGVLA